jgi:FixJ family two-component response regulator
MPQSPILLPNAGRLPAIAADIRSVAPLSPVVFIVAENPYTRHLLGSLLGDMGWQVRVLPSIEPLLAEPEQGVPSCVVLDISLPNADGLVLQKRLAAERVGTPVICITDLADISSTVRAVKAGALDVLAKPLRREFLLGAIHLAFERSAALLVQSREDRALRDCYASLSQRERQVMALVAAGLLNKQVGGELGISEITVKAHRGKVMRKMNVRSLAALVKIAGKLGLERQVSTGRGGPQPGAIADSSSISAFA